MANGVLDKTTIVPTISGFDYARRIHEQLVQYCRQNGGSKPVFIDCFLRPHSDGEQFMDLLDPVRGRYVYVVACPQTPYTHPQRTVNDNLMELMLTVDAAKRASARHITVVVPYFAYARQDKKDHKRRVPISAKVFARMLETVGAHDVITMDLHADQISGFFEIPVDVLTPNPLFASYVLEHYKDAAQSGELVVWSPDAGGLQRAIDLAQRERVELAGLSAKYRTRAEDVERHFTVGDPTGKHVVIVDDIYGTGGTMMKALQGLMDRRPKSVTFAITHNLCVGKGWENLQRMFEQWSVRMVTTDTIQQLGDGNFVPVFEEVEKEGVKLQRATFQSTNQRSLEHVVQLQTPPLFARAIYQHAAEASISGWQRQDRRTK